MTLARHFESEQPPLWRSHAGSRAHLAAAVLVGAGFLFDFLTPLGVAAGLIYTAAVLCSVWADKPAAACIYAAAGTALTGLGYLLLPIAGVDQWIVLANRILTVIALWAFAFVVYRQKSFQASLEQKQNELAAIQDNSIAGLINIDPQGTILNYNRTCCRMFGYSPGEVIGQNIRLLLPDSAGSGEDPGGGALFSGRPTQFTGVRREVQGRRKNGEVFPIELSVSEVRVGRIHLFSGILRDLSAEKKAEAERERFTEELARSNRDLDDFAYVASHDLRAPLRVIGNASTWLEEDLADVLDEDSRENLGLLRSRVARMERLLDDLLEYSRAGRKTDSRYQQTMPGTELMREVLMLIDKPEGFTITIAPGFGSIRLPNMPLKQIFANLVSNAIKHNDQGAGAVDISVEDAGDHYIFSVADNGPGIDPEYHDQIFKMFQTLKSRDEVEGSGIGLSIVKKHLERAGGTISVRSSPGDGCAFRFTWPKQQEVEQERV
ncbi:sensor histidine kinase [Leisingera aquaemixtae]|uniref:sensor histidine kinase n=1 Tax=Leisingera aquaemixtae TaxID=1396826 RepID=UPI0021A45705|nr:ATP-binding protein [Leisingera aquaemixtae]